MWDNRSAGGIRYANFGSFSEILVGRFAAQVGLKSEEQRMGNYFQEVYVLRRGDIRFLGVRRRRDNSSLTQNRELIPGAEPEG